MISKCAASVSKTSHQYQIRVDRITSDTRTHITHKSNHSINLITLTHMKIHQEVAAVIDIASVQSIAQNTYGKELTNVELERFGYLIWQDVEAHWDLASAIDHAIRAVRATE